MKHNLKTFLGVNSSFEEANIVINAIPYDGTASYRPGSRFAGESIRSNSLIGYETYSPRLDKDLENSDVCDMGDMDISYKNPKEVVDEIAIFYKCILKNNKKIATIGGEHSVSLGIIKSLKKKYKDLVVIQIDAHTDLREEYLGSKYSHACVMKRIGEEIGFNNLYQLGIRSGMKEEFEFAKKNSNLFKYNLNDLDKVIDKLQNSNVYITIDLDVLDPAFFPGTGTPEPNGITSKELFDSIYKFEKLSKIVGFDIVELAPHYDNSQISTAIAIKILKEMILILDK